MFYLKRNHNYNNIYKLWWQYNTFLRKNLTARLYTCQYCPTPDMFPVANSFCVPKCCYQSVYCCLIRYFLIRIRIAKCFTNSSKRFQCEVMFENEHTFCCKFTMFVPAQLSHNWSEQQPRNQRDLDKIVTGEVGREYFMGVVPLLI
jgi:hypothetical protein